MQVISISLSICGCELERKSTKKTNFNGDHKNPTTKSVNDPWDWNKINQKYSGNKNPLSLSLSLTTRLHTFILQHCDITDEENSEVQLMCLSANMNLEPARRLQSTTHETLSLTLARSLGFCNCLLLWFSYFSSRRLNNIKNISTTNEKNNNIRRSRRVSAVERETEERRWSNER